MKSKDRKNYFYGWYFRCQSEEGTAAVIPAIHLSEGRRTCSIQVITEKGAWNQEYPAEQFRISAKGLLMHIGENVFSEKGIRLNMQAGETAIRGRLRFGSFTRPVHDIMGPFQYLPRMECRHAVYSMCHEVNGQLSIGSHQLGFRRGLGYMEGDSGTSFPQRYVWTQHFLEADSFQGDNLPESPLKGKGSLMLAAAKIPLGPCRFMGTIGLVRLGEMEYRFATYLGAVIEEMSQELVIRQGRYRLTAKCLEPERKFLYAPCNGAMNRKIGENVSGRAEFSLAYGESVLLRVKTDRAAFESEL